MINERSRNRYERAPCGRRSSDTYEWCVSNSVLERLQRGRADEEGVLDDSWRIMGEYRNKLDPNGKPTPGQVFVKWILQNNSRVDWVRITATNAEETMFSEFPNDEALAAAFDPADRKFVAAANAHAEKPPILEAAD